MAAILIAPPAALLTLDDAKAHLRVDGADENAYIASLIAVAQGAIDGPAGWLGRSIGVQTLELRGPAFVDDRDAWTCMQPLSLGLRLPCGPVIDIVSASYLDEAGVVQTLDASSYDLDEDALIPVRGFYWPVPARQSNAVRVRYRAGYLPRQGDGGATISTVPAPILHAMKIMIGLLDDGRSDAGDLQTHGAIASLLGPFRVWRR